MVLLGVIGNISVVKLFIGGIIPGIILGCGLMFVWYLHVRKREFYKVEGKFSLRTVFKAGLDAFLVLLIPIIIIGGIVFGIATPTEVAVVSVVYSFILAVFIYKELKLKDMLPVLVNTVRGTAVVLLVCGAATSAAYYITTAQIPVLLAEVLLKLSGNSWLLFMLCVNILMLLVGCVMDLTPALLILAPMLLPIAQQFGIDLVYFGVVLYCEPIDRAHNPASRQYSLCGLRYFETVCCGNFKGYLALHFDGNPCSFYHHVLALDSDGITKPRSVKQKNTTRCVPWLNGFVETEYVRDRRKKNEKDTDSISSPAYGYFTGRICRRVFGKRKGCS
jgi:hypothetical protein